MNHQAGGQGRKKHPERTRKENRVRKNEEGLKETQDNVKLNNVHIIGIPHGEEEGQGIENIFE